MFNRKYSKTNFIIIKKVQYPFLDNKDSYSEKPPNKEPFLYKEWYRVNSVLSVVLLGNYMLIFEEV